MGAVAGPDGRLWADPGRGAIPEEALAALGENSIAVDCDVLQADGGTRTAAITGAYVALADAVTWLADRKKLARRTAIVQSVAAVSVGVVDGEPRLDLAYEEDVRAGTDMNVVCTGEGGFVAHECILDLRPLTKATGITVDDIAKRLADYGLHAPTMSFPVAGTLMVEPTESEDLAEIDRFCDAMIAIKGEIDRVAAGEWTPEDSPLRRAPHTSRALVGEWDRPYSRELGVFPTGIDPDKYWPPVARIDQAYGDRNLQCSCPPLEAFVD